MSFADIVADLIPEYVERRRAELANLKQLLAEGDFDFMRRIGHQNKGHAASYGFPELGEIATRLEVAAAKQDKTALSACIVDWEAWLKTAPSAVK